MLPKTLVLLVVVMALCLQPRPVTRVQANAGAFTVGGAAVDVPITGEHSSSVKEGGLQVLHGSLASPAMSRKPGVYWQRVDGSNNVNGDRYFSIYGRKSGGTQAFTISIQPGRSIGPPPPPGEVGAQYTHQFSLVEIKEH